MRSMRYEMLGSEVYLYLTVGGVDMTCREHPNTGKTWDDVRVSIDVEKIHIFDKETEETITN